MLPHRLRDLFLATGWREGRRVEVSAEIPTNHPAGLVLKQFAGITLEHGNRGEECAASRVEFRDDLNCPENGDLSEWQADLGTILVIIAELDDGHGYLIVDSVGRFFGKSEVHDAFWFLGNSFDEAMGRLAFGKRARPLLGSRQTSVTLYGEEFSDGNPGLYQYSAST